MSFVFPERLIEFAIRIGTDDLQKNATLTNLIFKSEKFQNLGADLTPPGAPDKTYEKLPMDYFQERLAQIPKLHSETGKTDIFGTALPALVDIQDYFAKANIKVIHGYPRDSQDLPCICINLMNEDEVQYLGQSKGALELNGKRYDLLGSDWATQYSIRVITPNYDETIIWYVILKYALTRYRSHLEGYGLREQQLSFMDIEAAPDYLQGGGAFVYERTGILACKKDEILPIEANGFTELGFGIAGSSEQQDGTIIPDPEA